MDFTKNHKRVFFDEDHTYIKYIQMILYSAIDTSSTRTVNMMQNC